MSCFMFALKVLLHIQLSRSKIFIRFPKTLFATEDALETRKHSLGENCRHSLMIYLFFIYHRHHHIVTVSVFLNRAATKLQAGWKGYSEKSKYQKLRTAGEDTLSIASVNHV